MTNSEYLKILIADQKLLSENIKVFGVLRDPGDEANYREALERYHHISAEASSLMLKIASRELDGQAPYQPEIPGGTTG